MDPEVCLHINVDVGFIIVFSQLTETPVPRKRTIF